MKKLFHSETYSKKIYAPKTVKNNKLKVKISTALFLQSSQKYLDLQSPALSKKIRRDNFSENHSTKETFVSKKKLFSICFNSPKYSKSENSKFESILKSPNSEMNYNKFKSPQFNENQKKKKNIYKPSNFFEKNSERNFTNYSNYFESQEKSKIFKKLHPQNSQSVFERETLKDLNHENSENFLLKLKVFKKVTLILTEIFRGKDINLKTKDLKLSEFQVILKVLKKKYTLKIFQILLEKTNKKNLQEAILELEKIIYDKPINISRKRIEENNKFIYKNSLKIMKKLFYEARKLPKSKSSEIYFYRYYFKEISKKKKISLEHFIDPLNVKQKVKTLNNKFLGLIFSSEHFKSDFQKTMKNELFRHYEKLILRKFVKFFVKFDNKYNSSFDQNSLSENVMKYLKDSKRIKFPWDKNEIENAVCKFIKKIKSL